MANFGDGDASYQAAGKEPGIAALVDQFYDNMEEFPEAAVILAMHGTKLSVSREKLKVFLTGWLGGPKLYAATFGQIRIPAAHRHLSIGQEERDAWMLCMTEAVAKQPWSEEFKAYFCEQIAVPADRVLKVAGSKSL